MCIKVIHPHTRVVGFVVKAGEFTTCYYSFYHFILDDHLRSSDWKLEISIQVQEDSSLVAWYSSNPFKLQLQPPDQVFPYIHSTFQDPSHNFPSAERAGRCSMCKLLCEMYPSPWMNRLYRLHGAFIPLGCTYLHCKKGNRPSVYTETN